MRIRDVIAGAVVGAIVTGATTAGAVHVFSDVPDDHPFAEDIAWMASTGISEGYQDGTYRPSAPVSRQAMSAFMRRLAGDDPAVDPMVDAASVGGLSAEDLGWHGVAVVNAGGTLAAGDATAVDKVGGNYYYVTFDRDVSECTYQATVGTRSGGFVTGTASASLSEFATTVHVQTYDVAGAAASKSFFLTVLC